MKAFLIDRYGKSGNTRIGDAPVPAAGDSDVLIQVHAASVNPVDFKIRDCVSQVGSRARTCRWRSGPGSTSS